MNPPHTLWTRRGEKGDDGHGPSSQPSASRALGANADSVLDTKPVPQVPEIWKGSQTCLQKFSAFVPLWCSAVSFGIVLLFL